ncbi:hypothetical protein TPAU25S_01757 [Tsukamurella paurometabola]|uniref:DUF4194 domain-containing protein n=1 Tax=Tsukamurella paurometabola (strain ATCC 8368 / DSM 20162 / CCUG 35730 / CIP 100753 / JCM 10117 / KCTC 9821 / NBRC 16120 / NCIMB 702349 / NCTC 13040) TaxID=521096 RepID=D5UNV9_TSUPD|nr:DUF4194 domain-containing protein [Tsukamurella paurometabola]ADG78677.1 conserved hypothetical protein [Tsukamurella paurometabola DSM 20162]SUP32692.1 Uncharacterised protein [Tsukamurella paurometabola]
MTDESLDIDAGALPEIDLADFSIADEDAVRSLRGADTAPRFDGDTSQLPNSVCYALQELIAAPHVSARSKNWAVIEAEETLLRSRLSELNLLLEINRETKHAFTRQVSENDPRQRNLLRAQSLSLAASVLALFLRLKHLSSPDETAVVERQEMIDHLLSFRPTRDTDEAGFVKKADAAINQLETRRLIRRVGTSDRYAVHAVIASLLTPEQVDLYTAAYRDLANTDHDLAETAAPDEGTIDESTADTETEEQK